MRYGCWLTAIAAIFGLASPNACALFAVTEPWVRPARAAQATEVVLAPDKHRLALEGLTRPLRVGERVPITLTIRALDGTTQDVAVDAEVRRQSPTDAHRRGSPHRH
jgi:hypothetical protein